MTAASDRPASPSLFARVQGSINVLYRELLKFGTIGAIAFVVDTGVFNLLRTGLVGGEHGLADKPLTAKVISALVATVVAWLGNRYWTFRHRRRVSMRREFVLFLTMNAGGLGISLSVLGFSHYVLGFTSALADNIAGNGIGLVLGTLFRFWAYRQLVFTAGEDLVVPEAPDEHAAAEKALASGAGAVEAIVVDLRTHARPITPEYGVRVPDPDSAQRSKA